MGGTNKTMTVSCGPLCFGDRSSLFFWWVAMV